MHMRNFGIVLATMKHPNKDQELVIKQRVKESIHQRRI